MHVSAVSSPVSAASVACVCAPRCRCCLSLSLSASGKFAALLLAERAEGGGATRTEGEEGRVGLADTQRKELGVGEGGRG